MVIESHYQDHLKKIMDQYDQGVVTYKEKLKAKYAKQANDIIQRNRIQIQHISSSNSTIKTAPPTATAFPPPPSASSSPTSDGNGNPNTATSTTTSAPPPPTTTTSTSTASTAATTVATMNGTASNEDVGSTASNALISNHHSVSFGFSSNASTTISSNSISTQQLQQTSQVSEYTPVSALINTRNASSYYPIITSNPSNHNASNHHLHHPSRDLPSAGMYDAYNYSTEIKEEQLLTESLSKRWIDRYLDASTMQHQPSIHHNQSVQTYNSKSMLMEPMESNHIDSSSSSSSMRRHSGLNSSGHSVVSYSTAGAMQQQLSSSSSVASATSTTINYNNNYQGNNNNNISSSTGSSNGNNRSVSPRTRQKATQSSSSTLPMNQQHQHQHLLIHPSSTSSNSANHASAMSSYASYENLRVSRSAVQFSSPLRQALKKNITLSSSSSSSASAMPSSSFLGPSRLSMTNNNNNNYQGNNNNNINVGYSNIDAATGKHFMADTSSRKQKVSEGRDPVVTNNSYLGKQRSSGAWKWSN